MKHRCHEEPRLNVCHPNNETFPIRLTNVDVIKETRTSANNVFGHDLWTCAMDVTFSGKRTGTTRFHILQLRVSVGHNWIKWKICEHPKDDRITQFMMLSLDKMLQETKENCRESRRKCQIAWSVPRHKHLASSPMTTISSTPL